MIGVNKEKINIVACTDGWFVMPTGVMICSVCMNNPDVDIVFHVIINSDVTPKQKKDLEKVVYPFEGKTIIFYSPNQQMLCFGFPPAITPLITKTSYYRLYVAELLPLEIEKVLYLDVDIIVRHSLLPLWNIDISHYAVAAAPDIFSDVTEVYSRLQIPQNLCYFNTGVLLINLRYWRENSVSNLFQTWILKHTNAIRYADQDVLNAVLKEKILLIPLKFNLMHGFLWKQAYYDYNKYEKEVLEARRDPIIVHFSGEKPWDVYWVDPPHPFVSTFKKYQRQTKWKGKRIDKRPVKERIINFMADILRRLKLKPYRKSFFEYIDIAPID